MRPLLLALLLTGCCRPTVAPCPEPPVIPNPVLRIHQLPADATLPEWLEAYALDLVAVAGQRDQLQALLDAYRRPR